MARLQEYVKVVIVLLLKKVNVFLFQIVTGMKASLGNCLLSSQSGGVACVGTASTAGQRAREDGWKKW